MSTILVVIGVILYIALAGMGILLYLLVLSALQDERKRSTKGED
jgi:phage shock protein PspC (stress-responsive transcriptional regulator)